MEMGKFCPKVEGEVGLEGWLMDQQQTTPIVRIPGGEDWNGVLEGKIVHDATA